MGATDPYSMGPAISHYAIPRSRISAFPKDGLNGPPSRVSRENSFRLHGSFLLCGGPSTAVVLCTSRKEQSSLRMTARDSGGEVKIPALSPKTGDKGRAPASRAVGFLVRRSFLGSRLTRSRSHMFTANQVAHAASRPTLAKNARMGQPLCEWCTQRSLKVGHAREAKF